MSSITNGYCTLTELYARWDGLTVGSDNSVDSRMKRHITAASRWIDRQCSRHFYALTATHYFTPERVDLVRVSDLVSVSTFKTDQDGDRTYETTWSATDYDLLPFNSPPYQTVELPPQGLYTFLCLPKEVEITGIWGWPVETTTASATLAEDLDASETGVDVSSGTEFEIGMTIRINSEDMFVDAIATNTLTVRRGQNGTTAATHTSGATITILSALDDVREACLLYASRLWAREGTVLGVSGATAVGTTTVRAPKDTDIEELLHPYVKRGIR